MTTDFFNRWKQAVFFLQKESIVVTLSSCYISSIPVRNNICSALCMLVAGSHLAQFQTALLFTLHFLQVLTRVCSDSNRRNAADGAQLVVAIAIAYSALHSDRLVGQFAWKTDVTIPDGESPAFGKTFEWLCESAMPALLQCLYCIRTGARPDTVAPIPPSKSLTLNILQLVSEVYTVTNGSLQQRDPRRAAPAIPFSPGNVFVKMKAIEKAVLNVESIPDPWENSLEPLPEFGDLCVSVLPPVYRSQLQTSFPALRREIASAEPRSVLPRRAVASRSNGPVVEPKFSPLAPEPIELIPFTAPLLEGYCAFQQRASDGFAAQTVELTLMDSTNMHAISEFGRADNRAFSRITDSWKSRNPPRWRKTQHTFIRSLAGEPSHYDSGYLMELENMLVPPAGICSLMQNILLEAEDTTQFIRDPIEALFPKSVGDVASDV